MKKTNTKSGFTLIELLVVIAIIGILSAVVTSSLQSGRAKARNVERLQTVDQLNKAMEIYSTATGLNRFPAVPTSGTGGVNSASFQGYNATQYCLGATSACGQSFNTTLNTEIEKYMGGGKIPNNPTFATTAANGWYRYASALGGTATTGSVFGGATSQCTATNCLPGAYLMWAMERTGTPNCGRGVVVFNDTSLKSYSCAVRIGEKVKLRP